MIGAVSELSSNIGFPAGWLLAKHGSRVMFLAAMILTSSGYAALWLSAIWWEIFHQKFIIICGFFSLIGMLFEDFFVVHSLKKIKQLPDKVWMYEEIMTNDDNLESNLLTSYLLKKTSGSHAGKS